MAICSLEDADRESKLEDWLARNQKYPLVRWNMKEKRELRKLFDSLDFDGSGEIDCDELADTLLSCNIAKTVSEVNALVHLVDEDNSGSIGFAEFLRAMPPPQLSPRQSSGRRVNLKENQNDGPIARLRSILQDENLSFVTLVSMKRRKLLMDATFRGAKRRTDVLDAMSKQRREADVMTGSSKQKQYNEVNFNKGLLHNINFDTQSLMKAIGGVVNKQLIGFEANESATMKSNSGKNSLTNENNVNDANCVEKPDIRNTLVKICDKKQNNGVELEGHGRRSALVVPLYKSTSKE